MGFHYLIALSDVSASRKARQRSASQWKVPKKRLGFFLQLMKHVSAVSRHIDSMFASELITLIVLNWGRSIEDIVRMECENQFGCVESMLGRWLFRIEAEFPSKYCTPRRERPKRLIIMIIPVNFVILNCSWGVTAGDFPQPQPFVWNTVEPNLCRSRLWPATYYFSPERRGCFPFKTN